MFQKKPFIVILTLGFSSGVPFLLLLSTLSAWLAESGINKTTIGFFGLATLPYSLKFLWAPIVDTYTLPFLSSMGKRRSWLLVSQIALIASVILLGSVNPSDHLNVMWFAALLVGFFSATQDLIFEAYRIELLTQKQIGQGASCSVLGYRLGMLFSGWGALYLADFFHSWFCGYALMSLGLGLGVLATLWADEPKGSFHQTPVTDLLRSRSDFWGTAKDLFVDFFKQQPWVKIFGFIILFKIGDTLLNAMSMPFLLELGFSKTEIAKVAKIFGITAMIFGVVIGGRLLCILDLWKGLLITFFLQIMASVLFVLQAKTGNAMNLLYLTMGLENFACGIGQVMLIAYLSECCLVKHTASYYGILSSCSSFARIGLTGLGGILADKLAWADFYSLVCLGCLPGCVWVVWVNFNQLKKVSLTILSE